MDNELRRSNRRGGARWTHNGFFIRDLEAVIIEEHSSPGTPKHCTGLVGEYTAEFYKSILGPGIIDNKYSRIIFHTPEGNTS